MIGDLVSRDVPVWKKVYKKKIRTYAVNWGTRTCYKSVVRVVEGGEVGHFYAAPIGIFALGEELIDRVQSVGLNGIIGSEDDELWNLGLRKVSNWAR